MILKLLLNTRMIWMIFTKILKNSPNKKQEILIVFDDMITNMLSKLNPVVTELFIRGRKLNISFVFITQSYFAAQKNIRLGSTSHYFIMKVQIKQEPQQTAFNYSPDIDFKDFLNLYKKCTGKPYFFELLRLLLHQTLIRNSKYVSTCRLLS